MKIVIATCRAYPNLSKSEAFYAAALQQLDVEVAVKNDEGRLTNNECDALVARHSTLEICY